MDLQTIPSASEPSGWFLCFFEITDSTLLNRIPFIRFRHVSAFGYCRPEAWVFYDVHLQGTSIYLLSHEAAKAKFIELTARATIVRIGVNRSFMPFRARFGFYCVPAMKHLVGLKCVALTPDALYRAVIKAGGTVISGQQAPATPARSDAAAPGAAESA